MQLILCITPPPGRQCWGVNYYMSRYASDAPQKSQNNELHQGINWMLRSTNEATNWCFSNPSTLLLLCFFFFHLRKQQQNMITVFCMLKCSVNFIVYDMGEDILVSLQTNQYQSRRLKLMNYTALGTENVSVYPLFFSSDSYRRCGVTFLIVSQGTLEATHFQVSFPKLDCPFLNNMSLKEAPFIFLFIEVSCFTWARGT